MRVPFPRVAISGFGCVSPLGIGLPSTVDNMRHSRDSVKPVRLFAVDKCLAKTAGQVDDSLREVATSILARSKRWTRAAQMILVAMAEALAAKPRFVPDCVVIGTTSGGMSLGEQFYRSLTLRRREHRRRLRPVPRRGRQPERFAPMPRRNRSCRRCLYLALTRPFASSRTRARPEQTRSDLPVR